MPKPPKITKDLRQTVNAMKALNKDLDALIASSAALAAQWADLPQSARELALPHCPTVARLVAFARRWV